MDQTQPTTIDLDCLFCKIVSKQIPASQFFENKDFIGILDLYPNTKGQTVLISKTHSTSNIFEGNFDLAHKGLDAAKKAAAMLKTKLGASRIALVTEGVFVDHLHLKLFPIYNEKEFLGKTGHKNDEKYFEDFPGFITTQSGPEADRSVLDGLVGVLNDTQNKN